MKIHFVRLFIVIAAAGMLGSFASPAGAQTAALATNFLDQATSAGDSELGAIASELAGKLQALGGAGGTNSALATAADNMLKSLHGRTGFRRAGLSL